MKKIISMGIVILALASSNFASAEVGGTVTKTISTPTTYSTAEAFLEAEGMTCETATDGCNNMMVIDGAFGATTLMYCEQDPVYSCIEEKEIEEPTMCTMQYAPVCGINGLTYGNSCMAGDTEIVYENECSDMVDSTLYQSFEKKTAAIAKIETTLSQASTTSLTKAVEQADALIASTKLLRIVQKIQIERITILTFIKHKITAELASR